MASILVVDDEPHVSRIVSHRLGRDGHEMHVAFDGEEGLGVFEANSIDLVVTDHDMPKKNGREMIEGIRASIGGLEVPILMVTGRIDEELRSWAEQMGSVEYMEKPLSLEGLASWVQKHDPQGSVE